MSCPSVSTPHMSQSVIAVTHCGQLSTPRQPIPGGQPTQPPGSLMYCVNLSPLIIFYATLCYALPLLRPALPLLCLAPPRLCYTMPINANALQCQANALLCITTAQPHCDLPRLSPAMRSNTLPCQCSAKLYLRFAVQLPCYALPMLCNTVPHLAVASLRTAEPRPAVAFKFPR